VPDCTFYYCSNVFKFMKANVLISNAEFRFRCSWFAACFCFVLLFFFPTTLDEYSAVQSAYLLWKSAGVISSAGRPCRATLLFERPRLYNYRWTERRTEGRMSSAEVSGVSCHLTNGLGTNHHLSAIYRPPSNYSSAPAAARIRLSTMSVAAHILYVLYSAECVYIGSTR